MKDKRKLFASCLCVMSLIFSSTVIAYAEDGKGPMAGVEEGPVVEGFKLSVHASKEPFRPDVPILLTTFLKNVTQGELSHVRSWPEADFPITVRTDAGQNASLTQYGRDVKEDSKISFGIGTETLSSKEEVQNIFTVNRMFDMTRSGNYIVTVKHFVPKIQDKTSAVAVVSNTLQIKVVDAAPPLPVISDFNTTVETTAPATGSPTSSWKIGDSWRLAAEWTPDASRVNPVTHKLDPFVYRYQMRATVSGEETIDGAPVWQVDFLPAKDALPSTLGQRYRVLVDKADGMARKVMLLDDPKGKLFLLSIGAFRFPYTNRYFPSYFLPFLDKPEVQEKSTSDVDANAVAVTTKQDADGRNIEAHFKRDEKEIYVVTQHWPKGAKWWSEYSYQKGKQLLRVQRLPDAQQWGPQNEGLQMATQLEDDVVEAGGGVWLDVKVRNLSGQDVTLSQTSVEKDFAFVVKNARGETMPLMDYGRDVMQRTVAPAEPIKLKAGQEVFFKILLNRLYDMTRSDDYSVSISRSIPKRNGQGQSTLTSPPVQIKVIEPLEDLSTNAMNGGF